jgi:hypothetical protein
VSPPVEPPEPPVEEPPLPALPALALPALALPALALPADAPPALEPAALEPAEPAGGLLASVVPPQATAHTTASNEQTSDLDMSL